MGKYETIIGLEIHLQLKTKSKMFCACSNDSEGKEPNTLVCPICLGHPGTLPTINKEAVKMGLMMSLAINCKINKKSKFDRKNYFYPDLPKGYQISQFDEPLGHNGHLIIDVDNQTWSIGIERLHLEEDAAKNIHKDGKTLVDFNRGGTPLAEIVTKPDFKSPKETKEFLQEMRLIARYLGVSDADMEKGHLRCDANISLRPVGDHDLYEKTEVKNLNSFKAVEKALMFEEIRQAKLWDAGTPPTVTETRGWDENKGETVAQRTKEGSSDYRYFPEPDLPPLIISENLMQEVRSLMPELPFAKKDRFAKEYGLKSEDAWVLVSQKVWANYFEEVMSDLRAWLFKAEGLHEDSDEATKLWEDKKNQLSKLTFNWISSELFGLIKSNFDIKDLKISAENMAELVSLIYKKTINSSAGQAILKEMFTGADDDPSHIAERLDLAQIDDDSTLEDIAVKIIMSNPEQTKDYKAGKEALLKFFVGQFMKESKGKANPQKAEEILKQKLK
ncbi:MAG: Asp-tRNA(Asn)/Glu-tRNA(Gln) amidotransferase subunit GatB [Candidatus Komeilibacteria bacterium]|jgi:aspartyl-tRNA(Asn)/glutamyl-tRNA(Gln) amidotransferase subunit B|nr:Asp-tRNA(Asn)/Glu-tRNA(Gln) amidotransferase subunit GatB [Candidatus Komeilibacteria bacterium]MBT4447906.1 Asp-tRNA(Asn)/Glu-tRNA(Gln) amidotransferase subunit GatB [Candidatus Komeilibacteria bacterium]